MRKFITYEGEGIAIDRIERYSKDEKYAVSYIVFHLIHSAEPIEVAFKTERGRNRAWNRLVEILPQ